MCKQFIACGVLVAVVLVPCWAIDVVEIKERDRRITIEGKVLVRAEDGGLLTLGRDGQIWPIQPQQVIGQEETPEPFEPLTAEELGPQLLAEMGPGFELFSTNHYLICHNANREFAKWCGQLFERLYRAFTNFWTQQDFPIQEPEFPLVVLVFADQASYAAYASDELGADPEKVPGFYSFKTNRVSFHDLTAGVASGANGRRRSATTVQRVLALPGGEMTIATIIHEATHQIAFNCGLQRRYADNPLWLSEGMANFFETPDLKSKSGWSTIGAVNYRRLREFRDYVASRRRSNSLQTLITSDERFRDLVTSADAYAEAWALNYFLLRSRRQQYNRYLQIAHAKEPLIFDTPEQRLADFQAAFGEDPGKLDGEFLRYMAKVR